VTHARLAIETGLSITTLKYALAGVRCSADTLARIDAALAAVERAGARPTTLDRIEADPTSRPAA
jgi:hypothetical protein